MKIFASKSFLTSLSIKGNRRGLILLSFFLKGLASSLIGIVCCMIEVSYTFRSSYFQAKTFVYLFSKVRYSLFAYSGKFLEILINFGSLVVPMLKFSSSFSEGTTPRVLATSLWSESSSNGTKPFGKELFFSCMISLSPRWVRSYASCWGFSIESSSISTPSSSSSMAIFS